ncbi:WAT1-related protein At3g28050-like isoform X2 [Glycine soja]|uniref:WAT1-related protein At3g28050-like isoform X2 n=1 Tax=Glycine soja TaxID=3848 RepID=UPI00103C1E9F|nr:WAT1-related protein At3g28050-like isoform X2 [Glycine soja]
MMDRRHCYKDLLPLVVLVANECNNTGLFTLFKAATLQGMSNYVFVTYAYSVAFLVLLPVTFFYRRSRVVPPLTFSILSKIALLGVIGCSSQILGYAGIRMEKIAVKRRTTQAKILGSIISVLGAFVVTFYKGQSVIIADNSPSIQLPQSNGILTSVDRNWVIGGLLLTACNILLTVWFVYQVEILKEFPDELSMVFFYNLCAAIVASIVGLLGEKNSSAWKIRPDISLISIVCTGIFNKFLSSAIYAWGIHLKGPVYVAMFKPLSIVIAVAMGVMFLGDSLYVGRIATSTETEHVKTPGWAPQQLSLKMPANFVPTMQQSSPSVQMNRPSSSRHVFNADQLQLMGANVDGHLSLNDSQIPTWITNQTLLAFRHNILASFFFF